MYRFLKLSVCVHTRKFSSYSNIRVRFAPSPTGFLHLGGLRTALFNYLFARKNNGKFILRIENTDQKRVKAGSLENFNAMLAWTRLTPDESPEIGGPYGPYIQSERLDKYQKFAEYLLESGAAYRCFCSELRLNLLKRDALRLRENRGYDNKCRHLEPAEVQAFLRDGQSYTMRFKVPEGAVSHDDVVFGPQSYDLSANEGDFIILKSDGYPTYHFASVVDDHLMEITHVLRGTEWLVSTPKHIMLYKALGWQPPKFAHLPLLMNSDRSKLSKRQESLSIEYFKNQGYASIALLNFLTAAGGGFGKQEGCIVHDLDTLSSKFNLESVNTGSCIVDLRKLEVFNQNHLLQQLSDEKSTASLIKELRTLLKEKYGKRCENEENNLSDSFMRSILLCYKDRMTNLNALMAPEMEYLWTVKDWKEISNKLSVLKITKEAMNGVGHVSDVLKLIPEVDFTQDHLSVKLKEISKDLKIPYSALMRALRVVLTAQKDGPGITEILTLLGKERSLERLNYAVDKLNHQKEMQIENV